MLKKRMERRPRRNRDGRKTGEYSVKKPKGDSVLQKCSTVSKTAEKIKKEKGDRHLPLYFLT